MMQERTTLKVHFPINETIDEIVFETVEVGVILNFTVEHLTMEVDGHRGTRTTLDSWEIEHVDGFYYDEVKGYFKSDEFLKYVEEAINE